MNNLNLAIGLLRQRLTAAATQTISQATRSYAVKPAAGGAGEFQDHGMYENLY